MTVAITAGCTACGACVVTCPEAALIRAPRRPGVIQARCTDCFACIEVCPVDAIEFVEAGVVKAGFVETDFVGEGR